MKEPRPAVEIVSTGRWLPDRVVTNKDLEKELDTSDEWIRERTGITERRLAPKDMCVADMGARASRIAMERAGVHPGEVDVIIVSTATPDRLLPSTACDLQALLGATNAAAYDISAACSGFLYALTIAEGHIVSGRAEIVLVVATEKMSSIVDWGDRSTAVLFGDGAGAVIVRRAENGRGLISSFMRSDGTLAELLWRPGGGARMPMDVAVLDERNHLVKMAGREVFKAAVRSMAESADQARRSRVRQRHVIERQIAALQLRPNSEERTRGIQQLREQLASVRSRLDVLEGVREKAEEESKQPAAAAAAAGGRGGMLPAGPVGPAAQPASASVRAVDSPSTPAPATVTRGALVMSLTTRWP